jgi:hypothetical protein
MTNLNPIQKYNQIRKLEAEAKYPNDRIIELYDSGLKIVEVAEIMGCGKGYVNKVLKRNNISTRNRIFYGHPMDSEEARKKKSEAGKGKTPWNKGLKGAQQSPRKGKPYPQSVGWVCKEPNRPDKLYFIKLHNGRYKVGRSYKGWLYRKKETAELLGEWPGKSIDIWNLEKKVLREFSQYKAPLDEMSMGRGMTEHFVETVPAQEVLTFIEKTLESLRFR